MAKGKKRSDQGSRHSGDEGFESETGIAKAIITPGLRT